MTGDEYDGKMIRRFNKNFGRIDPAVRSARKARERKSTRTPKERRRLTRTEVVNFKTTPEMRQLLRDLASENKVTMTTVFEDGLRLYAKSKGRKDV